ncbi:MAG: aldo/keto reductase [Thaumarchaeota archaeon]|nr:aldo/keto reductase [Nitrososphaerota archaeon]
MGTYYDPPWIAAGFFGWKRGAKAKVEAITAGFDSGMTLVDTAEIYQSEALVARATRGRKREDLFVASKVWSTHLRRDDLIRAFEKSLKRLETTYIDLYQVHWPNPGVPIRETMEAMDHLVSQGKLRHVGVSNFSRQQLEEANSSLPKSQLSSVQLSYSLMQRRAERDILPYCDREGIAFLAYYPLAHGRLVSDHRLDAAAARNNKSKSQVALRWLAEKENVFPIPRASRPLHVLEDAGASGWELSETDAAELDAAFRTLI